MRGAACLGVILALSLVCGLPAAPPGPVSQIQLLLPLRRQAYQTNEWIDVSVVRSGAAALPGSTVTLHLRGEDGSQMEFTSLLPAANLEGKEARQTEHLHLNGRLLRPGNYTVEASVEGATARMPIEVHSHLRKSTFKLVDWASQAKGPEQEFLGEDSLGFNVLLAAYGGLSPDDTIRGGLDYMWCCTMSGGHQMDLRMECDWSDPFVIRGGTARVVRRALEDRTRPNAIGVHFYDEPGLTWQKHPVTGENTPHNIPSQDRSFQSTFGHDPLPYYQVHPNNPDDVARWLEWGRWKLSFMDAAWQMAAFGVREVRPDFLPITQSVYGWPAYADGYYFNVVRSLPLISGHGGYDDYGGAYFNPSFTFEFGRARDLHKPSWYLPAWYRGMPADRFRMEQYLSFMNGLQGMMKPPDQTIHKPSSIPETAAGIVESNELMARIGTIFTTMPVTRPAAAVLYSMSQNLSSQARDMKDNYTGGRHGREKTFLTYLAGKLIHVPLFPVVEEDILDGTLAAHHRAVVLPGIDFLDPKVIKALESFAASGGAVLVSDDSRVRIQGAVALGCPVDIGIYDQMAKFYQEKKPEEAGKLNNAGSYVKVVGPLAQALKGQFLKLGIKPVLDCDNPSIVVARQAQGDMEYLFAVNAAYDAGVGGMNSVAPAEANLSVPADGRPVYDAVRGGPVAEFKQQKQALTGQFRFGPGQMRILARTRRPIGSVQALAPVVVSDYTVEDDPLHVEVGAVLADDHGRVLAGSAPLEVRLIDPLGVTRYDLYRATDRGTLKLTLPLAVNDPAGEWQVEVRDLLAQTKDRATFTYRPPSQCGALAGATGRAVTFGNDRKNIYRFFRTHQEVTLVTGSSPFDSSAAVRLEQVLKPWNIYCRTVSAAEVKARPISAEEAKTWCGLEPGAVKPGSTNDPAQVGFDLRGAVLLVGNAEDNPLIRFLQEKKFLPYQPDPLNFPGRSRGFLVWQRDGVGYEQESVTLIGYDAEGMAEAVGSLYEAMAGLDPLTRWVMPGTNSVTAATKAPQQPPEGEVVWKVLLPDRSAGMKSLPDGSMVVLTLDGSLTALDSQGKVRWQKTVPGGDVWLLAASRDGNVLVVGASQHLAGFNNLGQALFGVPLSEDQPAPVVTFVTVSPDGKLIAAGSSNGKLTLLQANGQRLWTIGGAPGNDRNTKPNPYLSGIFSGGKWLAALTQNEVHLVNVADGTIQTRASGVNGSLVPQEAGKTLILSDGHAAILFSPARGQVEAKISLPDAGVVGLALEGEGLLAGTEADGSVRKLKLEPAGGKPLTLWEHRVPGHLVKKFVPNQNRTAVAYWGGLLQVLDGEGQVKEADVFPQDIAAYDWSGHDLVVGLADGSVVALKVK